ncbi:hypothetical protein [Nonomuraea jiangxiensis]|uniref:Uncharacterized protein n=1 Tax=Nonomuraea jiangxiensis TaxID=633440 RepID=A0A1G9B0I0_9ACTN|nr:hypothetical protein [Nonomuraea jiangxiensis]SDK33059.1 hypothetical protein SAMN05421869_115111 [Nonomuraea jiangxiensis]
MPLLWTAAFAYRRLCRRDSRRENAHGRTPPAQQANVPSGRRPPAEAPAFNSVQRGIETVAARFNGLAELLRRPGSGPALLSRYAALERDDPDHPSGHTPRGTPVTVIVMTFELSPALIARYNGLADFTYIDATRETDATRTYNCHAYARHSTSPSGNVWMVEVGPVGAHAARLS